MTEAAHPARARGTEEPLPSSILVISVDGLRRGRSPGAAPGELTVLAHVTERLLLSAPSGSKISELDDGRLALFIGGIDKASAVAMGDQWVNEARGASVFGLRFPLSVGVATVPDDARDLPEAIAAAGIAEARASTRGGDMVLGYHVGMRASGAERPSTRVTSVLSRSFLPVDFHSIIRSEDEQRVGAIAVCCVATDLATTYGTLLEDAVQAGRLFELGQRARVAADLAFREVDDGQSLLMVGVHPAELLHPTLILGESGLQGMLDRLVVQLLVGTDATDAEWIARIAARLRERGIRFCVDDVDQRRDGIDLLRSMRPEFVSLSTSLVGSIACHESSARVVASFANLARDLDFMLVAKGAKDAPTRSRLRELGVPLFVDSSSSRPRKEADR